MAKVAKPDEAGGGGSDDAETLIARSRQPALGRQADRALGALARKIRALRDETRAQGGDEQGIKDLGAALRRVRAEIARRGEAASDEEAGDQEPVPTGAAETAGAGGARAPRSPGIRTGRPGARKVPKPQRAEPPGEPAGDTAAEPVRAPKMSRAEAGAPAPEAPAGGARRAGGMTPPPARTADTGGAREDKAEKKARKEAEKAERKRVKEAEKAEEKAARKARKEAEKAGRKAGKGPGDSAAS
ncbi:hypothetical protein [Paracoccus niistensis]|uniref:Uncharacterized protein n=1 Tax=Paracoccus niistensis TaxID=632935 RepID=A0ABV6I3S0_9RHOB